MYVVWMGLLLINVSVCGVCVCVRARVCALQWSEVLTPISHCLEENHVNHLLLTQPKFQAHLTTFKTDPSVNVLLLPFRLGSKGLNIVEATHVLLVEPQLNLATEVQAIRRVHYIGHTK